jgi:hypothetical protein
LNESARLKGLLGQGSNLEQIFVWFLWTIGIKKTLDKLTDQPVKLMPLDRGRVPDLSVSGDRSDLVVVDLHDPTTASETRSANAIAKPTPNGYQPCRRKISLITKINSCTQSKKRARIGGEQLNITRRWSLQYTKAALCGCSVVAKANL